MPNSRPVHCAGCEWTGSRASADPTEKPCPRCKGSVVAGKRPPGRPTTFTAAIGRSICEELASTPRSLREICAEDESLPTARTVHNWMVAGDDLDAPADLREFLQQYMRARELQAWWLADETLEIADDGTGDWYETDRGMKVDHDHVTRSRLRVDTRFKLAAILAPKRFGPTVKVSGDPDSPLQTVVREELVLSDPKDKSLLQAIIHRWLQSQPDEEAA